MVFCMTRKSSAQTATALAALWNQSPGVQKPWGAPRTPITVKDPALRGLYLPGYRSVTNIAELSSLPALLFTTLE